MNHRKIRATSIIFIVLVNTGYFWLQLPRLLNLIISFLLFLTFIALFIILIVQIIAQVKERFKNKSKNITILMLSISLILAYAFPVGMLDFSKLEGKNFIIAQWEGTASCSRTFKMKNDNRFIERVVCFGVEEYKGNYEISNDTIQFIYDDQSPEDEKYAYGILKLNNQEKNNRTGQLFYFRSLKEKISLPFIIKKYEFQ